MNNLLTQSVAHRNSLEPLEKLVKQLDIQHHKPLKPCTSWHPAGYSATEAVQALDGVLAMAQATWSDLGQTSEIVAVTLAQFNLSATETMRVANAMTAGITKLPSYNG